MMILFLNELQGILYTKIYIYARESIKIIPQKMKKAVDRSWAARYYIDNRYIDNLYNVVKEGSKHAYG